MFKEGYNNSCIRGMSSNDSLYTDNTRCVTPLQDMNKIVVNIAGYEVLSLLDTGSTISVINVELFNKIKRTTRLSVRVCDKQCVIANGMTITLDTIVSLPVKIKHLTFKAELYVLNSRQTQMIIGCDLCQRFEACIDFRNKHVTLRDNTYKKHETLEMLTHVVVDEVPTLNTRVQQVHIADSDTTEHQKQKLIKLVNKYEHCFANNLKELGRTHLLEYDIETTPGITPIRMRPYKCPYKHREYIREEIQKLLDAGLIYPSKISRWGFPTVLVNKPHSTKMRLCSDLRKINEKTIIQPYPMLNMNFLLADIGKKQCQYFTLIDLSDSYRQIPLSRRSQEIATMSTIIGDYSPTTCVFGLKNLPFVFTKLMDKIFAPIRGIFMDSFLDDIIIYSKTFEEHVEHVENVLHRLSEANLTAKPVKTFLCKKTVKYLGFTLNKYGLTTTEENVEKIRNFPTPKKVKDVRSFVALASFYRRLIKSFAKWAEKLYVLTKKSTEPFVWTEEADQAFKMLKEKLTTAPVLAFPNMNSSEPLIVTVDTSSSGIGYVLSQKQTSEMNDKLIERPIVYGSTHLRGNQKKMGSSDLELTGVCWALKKLDCFLRGVKFVLITDHKSLTYMVNKKLDEMKPQTARKIIFLQQYEFNIVHKDGVKIPHADALSRCKPSEDVTSINEDIEPVINNINDVREIQDITKDIKFLGLANLSLKTVQEAQKADGYYKAMYDYISSDKLPDNKKLRKNIKANSNIHVIERKLLYHIWNTKSRGRLYKQLCIPKSLRIYVLRMLHDTVLTGHSGTFKMFRSAILHVWWPSLYKDIQNYVSSCRLCAEMNTGHQPHIPLHPLEIPDGPFHTIHVDLLKFHTPSRGFNYVLVIIDAFSKFVVTKALKRKTASVVIKAIYEEFILKFGVFKHLCIISDNGLEFVNKWSKSLYELLGIKSVRTTAYKPSSNSQVERSNRTIITILRKLVGDKPKDWANHLRHVTYIINSSVSESTKMTPFSLVYGVEAKSVLDLCLPKLPDNITKTTEQAYRYWFDNITLMRKFARENIAQAKQRQKIQYDKKCRPHKFKVDDKVFIKINNTGEYEDAKLRKQYKGPFTIQSFLSDTNVILTDDTGKKLRRSVYINNLKKFNERTQHNMEEVDEDLEELEDRLVIKDVPHNVSKDEIVQNNSPDVTRLQHNDSGKDETQQDVCEEEKEKNANSTTKSTNDDGVDLPFQQVDRETFLKAFPDSNRSNKTEIEKNGYDMIKKVYRKRVLESGETEYYLSWADTPAKKHRRWVNRKDLSPQLQEYIDSRKLPCTKKIVWI